MLSKLVIIPVVRGPSLARRNPRQCLRSCRENQEDWLSLTPRRDPRMAVKVEDVETTTDRMRTQNREKSLAENRPWWLELKTNIHSSKLSKLDPRDIPALWHFPAMRRRHTPLSCFARLEMSAMPTDEPAQDTPSTIDTQQLQQLQQQQDVQLGQQQIQAPPQQDPPRKRAYSRSTLRFPGQPL